MSTFPPRFLENVFLSLLYGLTIRQILCLVRNINDLYCDYLTVNILYLTNNDLMK